MPTRPALSTRRVLREEALKRQYWGWDNVHLGPGGHELIADTVFRGLQSEGLADLKTAAEAYWMKASMQEVAEGETPLCSFEPGQDMLVATSGGEVVQEHATDGRHALRLTSKEKDYATISLEDGRSLRLVHENTRFLVDVFNPQAKDVALGVLDQGRQVEGLFHPLQRLAGRQAGQEHDRLGLHAVAAHRHGEERQAGLLEPEATYAASSCSWSLTAAGRRSRCSSTMSAWP